MEFYQSFPKINNLQFEIRFTILAILRNNLKKCSVRITFFNIRDFKTNILIYCWLSQTVQIKFQELLILITTDFIYGGSIKKSWFQPVSTCNSFKYGTDLWRLSS